MAIGEQRSPLLTPAIRSPPPLNHKRDVHILCCAIFLIYLAQGAIQNLQSTINTEGDLGTFSLGILYISFAVCSVFASLLVKKMGSKYSLVFGTTGCLLFAAANLMPSWYTMIPATMYIGFAASILWVAQGTYLTFAACSYANDNNLHEGTVIGQFNGLFWGAYASRQVFGNLITFALLKDKGGVTSGTTLLLVVLLCIMILGSILMCFLSKRNSVEQHLQQNPPADFSSQVGSLLKPLLNLFFDIRILLLIPLFAYSGLNLAFMWIEYTKVLVKPVLGERGVGGAMAIYGVFDAVSAILAGRITSDLSSISIIVSGGAFIHLILLIWLLLNYSLSGLLSTLLVGALWGIGDGIFNTQISALLGILFKDDLEGAFAQRKLWQTASIGVICFISASISMQTKLLILLCTLLLSVAGFLFLTVKVEKCFSRASSITLL